MKNNGNQWLRALPAFVVAIISATVWASLVQSHYNLQALASLGVDVNQVRASTMARDVFSGFTPTYGGYIAAPALLVAFAVAWFVARSVPAARLALFVVGGYLAILAAIPLVNHLSPVALLVGASRDASANFWMAGGGALAGLLFALMTRNLASPAGSRIDPHAPLREKDVRAGRVAGG
ncbi:hypothetical protein [Luteimonas saliphila]|uniref:hypothetical protein n=1 Tax=Luteimonas saliphila TaxID=2804919 RepID=UPI00192E0911|nr:hypothetical protein [Luteimonas saliphila]